jgi:hypothetical protein
MSLSAHCVIQMPFPPPTWACARPPAWIVPTISLRAPSAGVPGAATQPCISGNPSPIQLMQPPLYHPEMPSSLGPLTLLASMKGLAAGLSASRLARITDSLRRNDQLPGVRPADRQSRGGPRSRICQWTQSHLDHRSLPPVIGSSGRLVGYGGGLDRKGYLLHLEAPRSLSRVSPRAASSSATRRPADRNHRGESIGYSLTSLIHGQRIWRACLFARGWNTF